MSFPVISAEHRVIVYECVCLFQLILLCSPIFLREKKVFQIILNCLNKCAYWFVKTQDLICRILPECLCNLRTFGRPIKKIICSKSTGWSLGKRFFWFLSDLKMQAIGFKGLYILHCVLWIFLILWCFWHFSDKSNDDEKGCLWGVQSVAGEWAPLLVLSNQRTFWSTVSQVLRMAALIEMFPVNLGLQRSLQLSVNNHL